MLGSMFGRNRASTMGGSGMSSSSANPTGHAWGQQFQERFGQVPGKMHEMFQNFRTGMQNPGQIGTDMTNWANNMPNFSGGDLSGLRGWLGQMPMLGGMFGNLGGGQGGLPFGLGGMFGGAGGPFGGMLGGQGGLLGGLFGGAQGGQTPTPTPQGAPSPAPQATNNPLAGGNFNPLGLMNRQHPGFSWLDRMRRGQ